MLYKYCSSHHAPPTPQPSNPPAELATMTRICAGIYYYTVHSPQTPLPILSTRLRTEIVDLTATHTLTQIFGNPILTASPSTTLPITEAKYTFPLYESCAVTSFTAQIGTELIHGVVKPKAEATAVYTAAKAAGKEAALFEQNTGEAFTTSVGNIPAGCFVVIVIKYVHELKQDLEVEGVRLVVPTIIAPKYGWISPDSDLYTAGWGKKWNVMTKELEEACGGIPQAHGVSMEILATMNGSIRGIQSPSHPISVDIGTHTTSSDTFSPHKARATLALNATSLTGLDKDFTLIVNSTEMANPRAFLAPHPSLPDTSTLMVTLIPKFTLPQQRPEIVFIVDRSGSMYDKMVTLKSALHLFLASLPIGTYFNIVSFGQSHSFLWKSSQPYNEETFESAKKHVDSMDANMGGTEMYEPIKETVDLRNRDLRTEVLVLTDGEIWHTEKLFKYIGSAAEEGKVRFFSLGVGASVSHLLVEGISRAGKGYSQLVGDGENMQKKVMRMLKAALTPHVNDWNVDWEGKAAQLAAFSESQAGLERRPSAVVNPTMSLFDQSSNPDDPPSSTEAIPTVNHPPILQTPSSIPPLFAFARTTVYYILSTSSPPTTITLCGSAYDTNTNTIQPLALSIPVTPITSPFTCRGLYSLAGRKLLQDLEEFRCSYLPKDPSPTLIEVEGARLGVQFNLASKWTSFVAVTSSGDQSAEDTTIRPKITALSQITMLRAGSAVMSYSHGLSSHSPPPAKARKSASSSAVPSARSYGVQEQTLSKPSQPNSMMAGLAIFGGSAQSSFSETPQGSGGPSSFGALSNPAGVNRSMASGSTLFGAPGGQTVADSFGAAPNPSAMPSIPFGVTPSPPGAAPVSLSLSETKRASSNSVEQSISTCALNEDEENEEDEEEILLNNGDIVGQLSRLQLFSGYFKLSKQLLELLGYSEKQIDTVRSKLDKTWSSEGGETAFATVLVLTYLNTKLKDSEEEWELMADKARAHLEGELKEEEIKKMETEVQKLVDGLV